MENSVLGQNRQFIQGVIRWGCKFTKQRTWCAHRWYSKFLSDGLSDDTAAEVLLSDKKPLHDTTEHARHVAC